MNKLNQKNKKSFPGGFAVLMAVYAKDNVELFISAVESVFANSLEPDQMVLVVDGPIPIDLSNSVHFLAGKYSIEILHLPTNLGLASALNQGLNMVRTEWVLRADADDINLPSRFQFQADIINSSNNTIDLLGGAIQEVDSSGNYLGVRKTVEFHQDIFRFALKRCPFNHMTVGYKKEFVVKSGGYPEIFLKEDYALWASMLNAGAISYNSPEILVLASAGDGMYKRRGGFSYAFAEIELQRHFVKINFKTNPEALFDGFLRAFVYLMPSFLRGLIYEKFLRYGSKGLVRSRVQIRSAILINRLSGQDALASEPLDRQVKVAKNELHTSYPRRTIPDCDPQQSRT